MQRELKALHIENGVYYTDAVLRFDQNQVVQVQGRNLNTRRKQSNASGKSLLFAYLFTILYFQPPILTSSRRGQHRLMFKTNTRVTAFIESADDSYRIVQTHKGLQIFENGIDLEFTRQDEAQAFIRETIWPMTEPEFRTIAFLSSNMPFKIQRGDDRERLDFVEHLFDLWLYDEHHKWYKDRLKELRGKRDKMGAYADTEVSILAAIDALDRPKGSLSVIERKRSTGIARENELSAYIDCATVYQTRLRLQLQAESIIKTEPPKVDAETKKRLAALEATQEQWLAAKSKRAEVVETEASIKALKASLKKVLDQVDGADEDQIRAEIEQLSVQQKAYKRYNEELSELEAVEAPDPAPKISAATLAKLQVEEQTLAVKIRLLASVKGNTSSECLLCGSSLKGHDHGKALADARTRHEYVAAACPWIEAQLAIQSLKKVKAPDTKRGLQLVKALRTLSEELPGIRADLKSAQKRLARLEQDLVDAPTGPAPGLKELRAQVENNSIMVKQWSAVVKARADLAEATVPAGFKGLKTLRTQIEAARTESREIRDMLVKADQRQRQIERYESAKSSLEQQLAEVRTQIKAHAATLKDQPILEALAAAYSDKGVKLNRAQDICTELEHHLNNNRGLLYSENLVFSFDIGPNKFGIMVNRPNGVPSDVRFLSGSESEKWNQLLVLALIDMLPAAKRPNFVVLDEMTSGSDDDSEHSFIHQFLPALKSKIPNIFVVNPRLLPIDDSVVVTAVKKGSKARLETKVQALVTLVGDESV